MNYPIWDVPASGLLIAAVAILHVFISHFAVGGGLFLVLFEAKARRENDSMLLDYVRGHSRFFLLLTLVLGAVTGVGIWFTIGLVHPQGTASLISTFVWGWAIEWTFFVIEIAAAMVYYYGWDRLDPRTHLTVGWIYFGSAWMSLVVIAGIIGYMLTPGEWVVTRGFWDGFLNPTYIVSVVTRTAISVGLAGLYAFFTVSFSRNLELKRKVVRYAGLKWILPMAVVLPITMVWYQAAAAQGGVPVAQILGSEGEGPLDILATVLTGSPATGYPAAQRGAFIAIVAPLIILVFALLVSLWKPGLVVPVTSSLAMLLGLAAFGGWEFVREDLRKPWVIGQYMFVNGIRLPAPEGVPQPPPEYAAELEDKFNVIALNKTGVLQASPWTRTPSDLNLELDPVEDQLARGHEVFRLLCSSCHTPQGFRAMAPLVRGQSVTALEGLLERLALPVDHAGEPTEWSNPRLQLVTWRERRMPPFVGTDEEKRALAVYLAKLGGTDVTQVLQIDVGEQYFEENCSFCHGPDAEFPMKAIVSDRSAEDFYEQLGGLELINEMMPPFEGTDEERHALADYLAKMVSSHGQNGGNE